MAATFGTVLKEWRSIRRLSQLDLSNVAEVSTRHISFLESGRSNPSRLMALHLADALEMPRPERNRLLTSAGFAPMWSTVDPDSDEMTPVREAVTWTLERHNPYPAVVLDRHWNLTQQNDASKALLGSIGIAPGANFLDEMTRRGGLRDLITNWDEVARYTAARLRTESAAVGGDPIIDAAIERLVSEVAAPTIDAPFPPVVTVDIAVDDLTISLFSTLAQFGTAEDLALAEMKIELFFPADETTKKLLEDLAG